MASYYQESNLASHPSDDDNEVPHLSTELESANVALELDDFDLEIKDLRLQKLALHTKGFRQTTKKLEFYTSANKLSPRPRETLAKYNMVGRMRSNSLRSSHDSRVYMSNENFPK